MKQFFALTLLIAVGAYGSAFASTEAVDVQITAPTETVDREISISVVTQLPSLPYEVSLKSTFTVTLEHGIEALGSIDWKPHYSKQCTKAQSEICQISLLDRKGRVTTTFKIGLRREISRFRAILVQRQAIGGGKLEEHAFESPEVVVRFNPRPRIHALVIGVSRYGPNVRGLCHPSSDALDFGNYLGKATKASQGPRRKELLLSLQDIQVTTLRDEDATKPRIQREFGRILSDAGYRDTVLMMFSGHGYYNSEYPDEFYLIPFGGSFTAQPYDFDQENLSFRQLAYLFGHSMAQGGPRRLLAIVDTCHSGAALSGFQFSGARDEIALVASTLPDKEAVDSQSGDCLQNPKTAKGNSLFLEKLLEVLREGLTEGLDTSDGVKAVSLPLLFEHVARRVTAVANTQAPVLLGTIHRWLLPITP